MGRGPNANADTPTIIDGVLHTLDPNTTGIGLAEPAWSAWLEDNKVFYYKHAAGSFSARKQAHRHGYFWYALKRINGRLYKRYLGERRAITDIKLAAMAIAFAELKRQQEEGTIEP
jgi:hypothetical protein